MLLYDAFITLLIHIIITDAAAAYFADAATAIC